MVNLSYISSIEPTVHSVFPRIGENISTTFTERELYEIMNSLNGKLSLPVQRNRPYENQELVGWRNEDSTIFIRWTNLLESGYLNLGFKDHTGRKNLHLYCPEMEWVDRNHLLSKMKDWRVSTADHS